jgi:hypothetical protein
MKVLRNVTTKCIWIMLFGSFFFEVPFYAMQETEAIIQEEDDLGKESLLRKVFTQPADFYEEDIKGTCFGEYVRQASFGGGVLTALAGGISCGLGWFLQSSLHPDTIADMFGWGSFSCISAGVLLSLYHCVFKNCRAKKNQEKRKADALYKIAYALGKTPDCKIVTPIGRTMCGGGHNDDEDTQEARYRNDVDSSDEQSEGLDDSSSSDEETGH